MNKKNITKILKEEDGLDLNVSKDDYKRYSDKINTAVGDTGSITIEKDQDKYSLNEDDGISDDEMEMFADILRKNGVKTELLTWTALTNIINAMKQYGDTVNTPKDELGFDDGEFDRENNRVEYGVGMGENFDSIMNELNETTTRTININENITPRIKKKDLINYINKKK